MFELWELLKDKEYPSLLTQLREINQLRLKLDLELFNILGINFEIRKLYKAISEEIQKDIGIK